MKYYDDELDADFFEDDYPSYQNDNEELLRDQERREMIRREKRRKKKRLERRKKRRRQVMINRCIFGFVCVAIIALVIFGARALLKRDDAKSDNSSNKADTAATLENASESEGAIALGGENNNAAGTDELSQDEAADTDNALADDNGTQVVITDADNGVSENELTSQEEELPAYEKKDAAALSFFEDEATSYMGSEEMTSTYGILVNVDEHTVVSAKNAYDRISPASMTKILTLLVAAENIKSLEDTVTITIEDTDFSYSNDCSAVGFAENETVTVADLLYGTILPSGGDAAYALSKYVAGSHEAFVELMNNRLAEMGISDSAHFTNCVGLYDDNHYCNAYDMAVILEAAMDNPLCRQVLSTKKYTTSKTEEHPDGIDISNLFLRRIEDKDTLGEVIGAKTGYVVQSGNCAASYYTGNDGKNYICVTADAHSAWRCIYDHVAVYNIYAAENTGYKKQ